MKRLFPVTLTVLLGLLLGACRKDVINLQPINDIPANAAFQNMTDVTNAVNGVYGTWLGRRPSYISSFISDEVRLGTGSEYRNVGNILFNWQHVSDSQDWRDAEQGGIWTNLYQVIDRANRVLEKMVGVPTADATEAALKNRYRGEMLALRAMAHLELLRNYSETAEYDPAGLGVVIQRAYAKDVSTYFPSRNTEGEVVAFIDSTLSEARSLIPTTFTDISKITRNAVIASQARLYLFTKQWQKAADSATAVLTAVPVTTDFTQYQSIWRTKIAPSGLEVIWKLNVSPANLGNAVGSLWQDLNGAVQASPATKLLNLFDQTNDVRYSTFFRTPTTTPAATRNLIAKYGVVPNTFQVPENFEYDIKMIRSSELLLLRAEARAELDLITESNADLAQLRAARITAYTHTDIPVKEDLINAILQERYKELCFEGQRYYDLRRRGLPIARDLADVVNNTVIQNMPASNVKFLLPIPQQEVLANPNMQQNPGY